MSEFVIRYVSPHGRQEEGKFRDDAQKIEMTMRAVIDIDLSPLSQCSNIEVLELSHNFIETLELEPLAGSNSIKSIRLRDNRLNQLDLWPLHNSPNLDEIDLTGNRLRTLDITPVFRCGQVRTDSTVVLTADRPLQHVLTPDRIMNQFQSVRTDRADWTVTPVVIWNEYDDLLESLGWPVVIERMKHVLSKTPEAHWFDVQKGFLEALDMRELSGLDTFPQRILEGVSLDEDYSESRERIYDRVVDLLSEQIARGGSTLFLDVLKMKNTRASRLIPLILNERQNELENLEVPILRGTAFLHSLWMTSYGYDVVSALGIGLTTDYSGLKQIISSLDEAGYSLSYRRVKSVSHQSWNRTSHSLRRFIFRLARSGKAHGV